MNVYRGYVYVLPVDTVVVVVGCGNVDVIGVTVVVVVPIDTQYIENYTTLKIILLIHVNFIVLIWINFSTNKNKTVLFSKVCTGPKMAGK